MPDLTWIVALIPAFPLVGFLLNVFFIRRERAAGLVACGAVVLSGIVPSDAAVKAFVVNRIGDAGVLLAMMAIFSRLGTLTFFSQNVGGQVVPGFLERVANPDFVSASIGLGVFGTISVVTAIT